MCSQDAIDLYNQIVKQQRRATSVTRRRPVGEAIDSRPESNASITEPQPTSPLSFGFALAITIPHKRVANPIDRSPGCQQGRNFFLPREVFEGRACGKFGAVISHNCGLESIAPVSLPQPLHKPFLPRPRPFADVGVERTGVNLAMLRSSTRGAQRQIANVGCGPSRPAPNRDRSGG